MCAYIIGGRGRNACACDSVCSRVLASVRLVVWLVLTIINIKL
jgi:hypothetical protein